MRVYILPHVKLLWDPQLVIVRTLIVRTPTRLWVIQNMKRSPLPSACLHLLMCGNSAHSTAIWAICSPDMGAFDHSLATCIA